MDSAIYVQSLPSVTIGRRDDNLTNEVRIDCSLWVEKYPYLTTYRVEYVNAIGQKNIAHETEFQNTILTWTITSEDTAIEGEGKYQIIATGRNGEQKASREATLYVRSRIHGDGQEESPEYMKPLLDQVAENASRAEAAAERAENIGSVTTEQIQTAVDKYLKENPVQIDEHDPTVPSWAKAAEKPSYTAQEVGALDADSLEAAVDEALQQAKASGDFKGDPGEDGYTPVKGIDYYTESDKAEMVSAVLGSLKSEEWIFTLVDNSTITKKVVVQ